MGLPNWLKKVTEKIGSLNYSIENYKKDTVIQALPTVALVNQGKKLFEKGDYLAAKLILDKAMAYPQKDARVLKYQGMVSEKLGQVQEAVEYYQNSADLNPQDKIIWQKLGFALIAVNKFVEAEKSFENAEKISHGNTDTHTGWGMALMKQQLFEEAREHFIQASKINRYNFTAIFLAAVMDIRLNELDKAETRLAFLANVSPNESNTYEYAHLKFIKKDYENALFYAKKSLEYNPNMLPAYLLISNIYTLNWDEENAIKHYEIAEKKELISMPLYLEWGLTLQKFDRFVEAKEKFYKALELMPEDKDVLSNLALCHCLTGNIEEAEKFIALTMDMYSSRMAQAVINYHNNNTDDALSMLRKLSDENSDTVLSYYYMAKCYERLNNDTKVKECYNTAIDKKPIYYLAYLEFAKYLFNRNEYADAQRKLRKALKFSPNNVEILNLIFYSSYKLVKENICEYNIKEALGFAEKAENQGKLDYPEEKSELLELLKNIQDKETN